MDEKIGIIFLNAPPKIELFLFNFRRWALQIKDFIFFYKNSKNLLIYEIIVLFYFLFMLV